MNSGDLITNQSTSGNVMSDSTGKQSALPEDVIEALGAGRLTEIAYVSSGATSSVFSANDTILGKRVAIKLLQHGGEQKLVNFQTEARTACKLDHSNLVKILNFGVTSKNHAYLIMDFVDGQPLDLILQKEGLLSMDQAIPLLMQICDGMAHSHAKNIAHRDLKTSNIIIQKFGTREANAIIVDFGLAKERESQDKTTQDSSSGKVKGSPLFISPEQAQGKHGDERSDVYSLGCIIFKMLTGTFVFEANDLFDLLRKHIEEPAPSLKERAPQVPFKLRMEACVQQMLEKDPDKRIQSMLEVKEKLERAHRMDESSPDRESVPSNPVKKRFRSEVAASLLFAALSVVSVATWLTFKTLAPKHITPAAIAKKEESATHAFRRLYKYDKSDFLSHFSYLQLKPKDPAALTDADLDCLSQVRLKYPDINLSFTKISGKGLSSLKNIKDLKLDLTKTALTDEGYEAISKLKNLVGLSLAGTKVNEKQLAKVVQAGNILEMNIDTCLNITDQSLQHISSLPLKVLTARDAKTLTDRGISYLSRCKTLKIIHCDGQPITDNAIASISKHGDLIDVRANRCPKLTAKSLSILCSEHPHIQYIGMAFSNLKPKDLQVLRGHKDLKFLELLGIPMGSTEFKLFGEFTNLEYLYLSNVAPSTDFTPIYPLKKLVLLGMADTHNLDVRKLSDLQRNIPRTAIFGVDTQGIHNDAKDVCTMFLEGSEGK